MNIEEYRKIYDNIVRYPKYEIIEDKLYRIKKEIPRLVIEKKDYKGFMYLMHDHELSAHFGIRATQDKVKEKYYWKNMNKDIESYVKSCD